MYVMLGFVSFELNYANLFSWKILLLKDKTTVTYLELGFINNY